MQKDQLVVKNKSNKSYFLVDTTKIYFTGDFDSGNLQKVEQVNKSTYRITPGFDKIYQSTCKTFFHFKTNGFKHCSIQFLITRAYLLEHLIKFDSSSDIYHPVVRKTESEAFQKITKQVKIYYNLQSEPELSFIYDFQDNEWVQFAFSFPYSYQQNQSLLAQMQQKMNNHPNIYFYDQILCKSAQNRNVHLLTITQKINCQTQKQPIIDGILTDRSRPFMIDKPKIVISGRVHPGETPASYCMEGIIKFLLNEKDYRSYLLRKNFHFILIPMLNPDGVHQGMFRNDLNGVNLNRFYRNCEKKHIQIWSVKKFIESQARIDFFFDLHAHPSKKGFFIYGNAFDQFLYQVKMIEFNCPYFQSLQCVYSQRAMISKDKNDKYTKQGCARVFYHKTFNIIHSYTVQCGYFAPSKLNSIQKRQFNSNNINATYSKTDDWEQISTDEYTPQSYMFLGKSILLTLLDLFKLNPQTQMSSNYKQIGYLRKFMAQKLYNQVERFRKVSSNNYGKIKNISYFMEKNYYQPKFQKYRLSTIERLQKNEQNSFKKRSYNLNLIVYKQPTQKNNNDTQSDKQTDIKIKSESADQLGKRKSFYQIPTSISEQKLNIHVQLLNSFEKYNRSFSKSNKDQTQKALSISCFKKTIKNSNIFFKRSASPQLLQNQPKYKKIEKDMVQKLLKQKLNKRTLSPRNKSKKTTDIMIDKIQAFLSKGTINISLPVLGKTQSKKSLISSKKLKNDS